MHMPWHHKNLLFQRHDRRRKIKQPERNVEAHTCTLMVEWKWLSILTLIVSSVACLCVCVHYAQEMHHSPDRLMDDDQIVCLGRNAIRKCVHTRIRLSYRFQNIRHTMQNLLDSFIILRNIAGLFLFRGDGGAVEHFPLTV